MFQNIISTLDLIKGLVFVISMYDSIQSSYSKGVNNRNLSLNNYIVNISDIEDWTLKYN